jgi:putative copper export protein
VTELALFLHVLSASAWLGAALWVAGDVRRTLALGKPHLAALPARVSPALSLDVYLGLATIVTGALVLLLQGIHPGTLLVVGMVLALARLLLVALAVKPAWSRLRARIDAGEAVPASDPTPRRIGMLTGIAHVLWLGALATMIF